MGPYTERIRKSDLLPGANMGYNRSGARRTKRLKRAKKHLKRLAAKAAAK